MQGEGGSKQREEWPERARTGVCPWVKRVRITVRFSSGTEDGAACHMARPPPPPPALPCQRRIALLFIAL